MIDVICPRVSANEDNAFISILVDNFSFVKVDECICLLETTKSTVEVLCEKEGYIKFSVQNGAEITVGQTIAKISDDLNALKEFNIVTNTKKVKKKFTKKAVLLMTEKGLDESLFDDDSQGGIISEEVILKYLNVNRSQKFSFKEFYKVDFLPESVLIVGAGHGNLSAMGYFNAYTDLVPSAFIDYMQTTSHGYLMNLPKTGVSYLKEIFDLGCRKVFIHVPSKYLDKIKTEIEGIGFEFVSCIHKNASISKSAVLGRSIMIGPNAVLDEYSEVKDFSLVSNNSILGCRAILGEGSMILNGASVAHDATIGRRTIISDGARVAGRVKIGDNVLVGLNSSIVMDISVGNSCIINSGAVLTSNLDDHHIQRNDGSTVKRKIL